jgi:PKD repeat protein
MNQDDKSKKFLIILVVVILISAGIALATTYSFKIIEQKEEIFSVKIFADPSIGTAPLNVSFSPLVTNYRGNLGYLWDFGDGRTSEEKEPSIIYEDGEYTCILKVTDKSGEAQKDSIRIIANKNKPPIVTLSVNNITINRKFNWLEILSLTPIASYAGNKQLFLDMVEERKGADAWGEGRIVVTAQIMDPEDDEIVSYDWKVQTADKVVTNNFKEWLPVKNLIGEKSVKLPELYTWLDGRHIVILTVTDSAGNQATANIDYMVSASSTLTRIKIFGALIIAGLTVTGILWRFQLFENFVSNFLDEIWFDLPPKLRNLTLIILPSLGWDYDPPIPIADLDFSGIADINLSQYVNDTTGEVKSGATANSSFTIYNNDSVNTAENIFITLEKPINYEQGLKDELEIEDLSVEIIAGITSDKLFYKGNYTNWRKCFNIERLSPGDSNTLQLSVSLTEGALLNKGSYECTLYIYQEKALAIIEYIDEIPFRIII